MLVSLSIPLVSPSAIAPVHAAGNLFVGPAQQGPIAVGANIPYQVNVTGMDPFDSWDVVVQADPNVLYPVSISVAGNMLGSVTEVANCVNGSGSGCSVNDNAGGAHSAAASNSGVAVSGSGLLFTITYRVVKVGFSYLTIPAGLDTIARGGILVSHTDSRPAVYGNPPVVPVASFTFSPAPPANITQGVDNVTFDASLSSDPAGGTITNYAWKITRVGGGILDIRYSTSRTLWVHQFNSTNEVGDLLVTLTVTDNLGKSSQPFAQLITVLEKPVSDLVISGIRASPQDDILPGTPVVITATVLNKGTLTESRFNLTIFLDGRFFNTVTYTGTPILRGHHVDERFTLDTTGLRPNSYDVVGKIQPSTDPNSNGYLTIRIIVPILGAPIPLTVPEFIGLMIAVLAVVGVVRLQISRLRLKRRLREQELS
jgi:hypothetical protein